MAEKEKTPLETAVAILTRQAVSRQFLKKKLHDKGFSWKTAEETARECERYGYINDKLTAESKVGFMRDRGDGSRKIKLSLRMKGFPKEIIDQAISTDEAVSGRTELSIALDLLRRKKPSFDREKDIIKKKTRALRALASKGFPAGISYQAISDFFGDSGDSFEQEAFQ